MNLILPVFYTRDADPDDTVSLVVLVEELTDEEAREYADSLTTQEAREHLEALMNAMIA